MGVFDSGARISYRILSAAATRLRLETRRARRTTRRTLRLTLRTARRAIRLLRI